MTDSGPGREEISMRKLLGLFLSFAALAVFVGVDAGGLSQASATPPSGQFSSTEYGRAQQLDNAKVVASSGYNVESATYTLAPSGDTGWRTGPGTTALAVTKGVLKLEQAEGCAGRDLAAGNSLVLPPGKFRLHNAGQEPVELLANCTDLSGNRTPLVDGPADAAPACAGFAAAAVPNGVAPAKSFRGDVSAYFQQVQSGQGGGKAGDGYATKELSVKAGLDTFMATFTLQPG